MRPKVSQREAAGRLQTSAQRAASASVGVPIGQTGGVSGGAVMRVQPPEEPEAPERRDVGSGGGPEREWPPRVMGMESLLDQEDRCCRGRQQAPEFTRVAWARLWR